MPWYKVFIDDGDGATPYEIWHTFRDCGNSSAVREAVETYERHGPHASDGWRSQAGDHRRGDGSMTPLDRTRQPDPGVGRLCGLIENHDGPHSWEEAHER